MRWRDFFKSVLMETGGTASEARESFVVTVIVVVLIAAMVIGTAISDSKRAQRRSFPARCEAQCNEAGLRMVSVDLENLRCHCGAP